MECFRDFLMTLPSLYVIVLYLLRGADDKSFWVFVANALVFNPFYRSDFSLAEVFASEGFCWVCNCLHACSPHRLSLLLILIELYFGIGMFDASVAGSADGFKLAIGIYLVGNALSCLSLLSCSRLHAHLVLRSN